MRALTDWLLSVSLIACVSPAVALAVGQSSIAGAKIPLQPNANPAQITISERIAADEYTRREQLGFESYKPRLMQSARNAGVREATIQAYVPSLRLQTRAIELDRAQAPITASSSSSSSLAAPLSPYLRRHVTPSLISRGQARYYSYWPHLVRITARYGVDPAVSMAIYGKETSYGSFTGSFDLLDVLASLAYDGRRREMFESEFVAALKLLDVGFTRAHLRGSYAGATGLPQFMPSAVLRFRADGDGDGQADIWNSEPDAIASISNYLREAGWKPGVPWGTAVRLPATFNREAVKFIQVAPRCPAVFRRHSRALPYSEWRALGITTVGNALLETEMASLLELDGPGGPAYLITANYRAILEYNCSNSYAMSIGLLADAIARR
jgi:membrane-bound lytic murein transglycosylase B